MEPPYETVNLSQLRMLTKRDPDSGRWEPLEDEDLWAFTLSRHRDSDHLENSNYECVVAEMEKKFPNSKNFKDEHWTHWAVGWIDHLNVKRSFLMSANYQMRFYTHSGMRIDLDEGSDLDAMKAYAERRRVREEARGFEVDNITGIHKKRNDLVELAFEFTDPDCGMIGDDQGTLIIKRIVYPCKECGCEHGTKDDAAACCAFSETECQEDS